MFKKISFQMGNDFKKKETYIEDSSKYLGVRLASFTISEQEKAEKISSYSKNEVVKKASENATRLFNGHLGIISRVNMLDLVKEVDPEEYIFFRCRAIDAGGFEKDGNAEDLFGANDNGDYFSVEELLKERVPSDKDENIKLKAFETFVGKQFFTNHKNDDIEQAKGIIVNSFYDLQDHCVYCDVMLDAVVHKNLARGIKQGYIKDVSMGCAVEWSECSICKNKAANINEYCDHVRNHKNKTVNGKKVFEINHDLKFIELSAVVDGAFKKCVINDILSQDDLLKDFQTLHKETPTLILKSTKEKVRTTVSHLKNLLVSAENKIDQLREEHGDNLVVTSSIEEITKLTDSLDLIRDVAKTMIEMDNVDYEYVKDLTSVLEQLQKVILDLASAGFNQEESTGGGSGKGGSGKKIILDQDIPGVKKEIGPEMGGEELPPGLQKGTPPAPEAPPIPGRGNIAPETKELPLAAENNLNDGLVQLSNFCGSVKNDFDHLATIEKTKVQGTESKSKVSYEYDPQTGNRTLVCTAGQFSMTYEKDGDRETVKSYYKGDLKQEKDVNDFSPVLSSLIRNMPEIVIDDRLTYWKANKEVEEGEIMTAKANLQKTSATDEVLGEQLVKNDNESKHKRETYKVDLPIGEKQLEDYDTGPKTGPSEYLLGGNVQKGRTSNERVNDTHKVETGITEDQLKEKNRRLQDERNDNSKPVQESQLEENESEFTTHRHEHNRASASSPITEGQFDQSGVGNKRLDVVVMEITEGQASSLREDDKVAGSSTNVSKAAIEAADRIVNAFTQSVVKDGISPNQIIEACKLITSNEEISQNLVNSNPSETLEAYKLANEFKSSSDMAEKVALRIAEQNAREGLVSNDEDLNKKWIEIQTNIISAFVEDGDSSNLKRVVESKVDEEIEKLRSVASGKKNAVISSEKSKEFFKNILSGYVQSKSEILGSTEDKKEVEFSLASESFDGITKKDSSFVDKAKEVISNTLEEDGIFVKPSEIEIVSISDVGKLAVNGIAKLAADVLDQIDDVEDEEENEEELSPLEAAKVAVKKVYAQQPPVGLPGGNLGNDQGAPPPAGGGGPGVGQMSTPPQDDFAPLDEGDIEDDDLQSDAQVGTPMFPGTRCPTCGEIHDLEQIEGNIKCSTCGTKFSIKFALNILEGPVMTGEAEHPGKKAEVEDGEPTEGEDIQNELQSSPTGGVPAIPTAAKYTVHPKALLMTGNMYRGMRKNANVGDIVAVGHRCPSCGGIHSYVKDSKFTCLACGTKGKFTLAPNKENNTLVDVHLAWVSANKVEPVSKSSEIYTKYVDTVKEASKVIEARASKEVEGDVKDFVKNVAKELFEDGYSLKNAATLATIIQRSVSEELKNSNPEEDEEMKTTAGTNADNFEKELDALLSTAMEDFAPTTDEDEFTEDEVVEDGGAEDEVGDLVEDVDTGFEDEETDDVEEDDDEEGFGEEEDENEASFDSSMGPVTITIDEGNITVEQEDSEVSEDEEEMTDEDAMFGEDEGLEEETETPDFIGGEEGETLDDSYEADDFADVEESKSMGCPCTAGCDEDDEMEDEDDDDDDDDDVKEANEQLERLHKAQFMNDKGIRRRSDSVAGTIDFDHLKKLLEANGKIDMVSVNKEAKKRESIKKSANKIDFTDPSYIRGLLVKAQSGTEDQTMPSDIEDAVGKGEGVGDPVPRKKEVGLSQTEPKNVTKVKTNKYKKGKGGNVGGETSVVPRSPGNSGMEGQKSTEFAEEKGDNVSSGNPNTYTQNYNEQIAPTPKSSEENRVRANSNENIKVAEKIQQIAKEGKLDPKSIQVKKINGLYIAAAGTRTFKWGNLTKNPSSDKVLSFNDVNILVTSTGEIRKEVKAKEDVVLSKTASSGAEAKNIVAVAQNVPKEYLQQADMGDEYVIMDLRNNKTWSIRKSKKERK